MPFATTRTHKEALQTPAKTGLAKRVRIPRRIAQLRRSWLFLLVPFSLILTSLAHRYPEATEALYARRIYPVLRGLFARITSLFSFSLAEVAILTLPLLLLGALACQLYRIARHRGRRRERIARTIASLLCAAGVLYGGFTLLCGLNYHRESFAVHSGLTVRPSSTQELYLLCEELAGQAREMRSAITEDSSGVMQSSIEYRELGSVAREGYESIAGRYPALGGYTVRPKPVAASRGMSYLDITGVYVPFTFEANVNVDVPAFWIPSTTMHELAHSKGFMREEEANFIAYLSCLESGHPDFAYSGTMLALIHSTNALYAADRDLYAQIRRQFSEGMERDLAANSTYWKQFEGPVAEVSTAVNDVYLRSNRQSSGVKSYGQMVDLLLAEYRSRHGLD